jgi:hypothetical protein
VSLNKRSKKEWERDWYEAVTEKAESTKTY